jgi:hypothetical protein
MSSCGRSLFDNGFNYIKVSKSDFVAVEGRNTAEKLMLGNLRIPYSQILKGTIRLKKGQENYLLNHLGLGDNVTFLSMKVTYDVKSVIKENNYITYSPYDDINYQGVVSEMMVLTGNSKRRIPQLFLSNPNENYPVTIEVMIAVIDDNQSFFKYNPVVYFTNDVELEGTQYMDAEDQELFPPFNTTLGDEFYVESSIFYYYSTPITKEKIINDYIIEVRDSNNRSIDFSEDNFILKDSDDEIIETVELPGTYYLTFDITDSLGNSIEPIKSIKIKYTND